MANSFGYINKNNRTPRSMKGESVYYDDPDFMDKYEYHSFEEWVAPLSARFTSMDLDSISHLVKFHLETEEGTRYQSDWMFINQINNLSSVWMNFNNKKYSIHFNFDPSVLYQINSTIFNYKAADPQISNISESNKKNNYLWREKLIQESAKLNIHFKDGNNYASNGSALKCGFGYEPYSLSYSYLGGAFYTYNSDYRIKPLEQRMSYKLVRSGSYLRIYRSSFRVVGNLIDGYDITNEYEWILENEHYFDPSSANNPTICITVCQPSENGTNNLSYNSNSLYFSAGETEFYYIDFYDIPETGMLIRCSMLEQTGNSNIPFILNNNGWTPTKNSEQLGWLYPSDKGGKKIVVFTSPKISVGHTKTATIESTEARVRSISWKSLSSGDGGIDEKFTKISDDLSMPAAIASKQYVYEIPYFYTFFQTWVDDIQGLGTMPFELNRDIYVLYNNNKSRDVLLTAEINRDFWYNVPGLGDFNYTQDGDSKSWKYDIYNNASILTNFSHFTFSDIDAHSLLLFPTFFWHSGEVGNVDDPSYWYIYSNLMLPVKALFQWNQDSVSTINGTTTNYKTKTSSINYSKLQNMWGVPSPFMEDFFWWRQSKYKDIIDPITENHQSVYITYWNPLKYNIPWDWTDVSEDYSLFNVGRTVSLDSVPFQQQTTSNKKNKITNYGRYTLAWWKNTTSIALNDASTSLIETSHPFMYEVSFPEAWAVSPTTFPLMHTPVDYRGINWTLANNVFTNLVKQYNYAYPQSSQAPGAIAIYAVTW